jgi:hypothetical protein
MKKWRLVFELDGMIPVEVEAEDEEGAIEKGKDEVWGAIFLGLPGLGDPFYLEDVEEIEDWS